MVDRGGPTPRLDALVRSAVPLADAERQELETRLRARYGHDLPITFEVDGAILGGLILRVGDRYIDGSVANRLGQLRRALTGGSAG